MSGPWRPGLFLRGMAMGAADVVPGVSGGTLALITLVGVLAAPLLIWLFAPGFGDDPHKRALAVEMLRLTFPYLFFISLTAFAGAILNTWNIKRQQFYTAFASNILHGLIVTCT